MTSAIRVALITEGSYPVYTGGVSTWSDQLIGGLSDINFDVSAIVGTGHEEVRWPVHDNCRVRLIGMWAKQPSPYFRFSSRDKDQLLFDRLLRQLWIELLRLEPNQTRSERVMERLVELSQRSKLSKLLARRGSTAAILNAWLTVRPDDDTISVSDAIVAASMVDRYLALIDVRLPDAEIFHVSNNGASGLVGLVNAQRHARPLLMSEHGVYLRERYIALQNEGYSWHTRTVVMAFIRMLCIMCYRASDQILPVNQFNARWERRLMADPERITSIPNGVEVDRFPPLETEPQTPTISFVGRIDPLKDIATLLRAHAIVVKEIPKARLRIFGPVPHGNEAYAAALHELAEELGLGESVSWEGPSRGARPAIEAGSIVALSSVSEGLPFTVIESMMSGRATVNTDVGGVGETVGYDQLGGLLVPARDPEAFAAACIKLLGDAALRRQIADHAAARARALFSLSGFLDQFDKIYTEYGQQSIERRTGVEQSGDLPNAAATAGV